MVDINNVYTTVLNILNKEQRGFLTSSEFNTLAKQAQTEIFEKYFYDQNRIELTNRMSAGDYNNVMRNIEEKITFFDNNATIATSGTTGFFSYPADFYRLGVVSLDGNFADEVSHKDILYIEKAPLTASTAKQPKYTRHEDGIFVYPLATTSINIVYVRQPAIPSWAGAAATGQPVALPSAMRTTVSGTTTYYQDFELHSSEEPELVAKILFYAGVLVRDPEAAQAGAVTSQSIAQTES